MEAVMPVIAELMGAPPSHANDPERPAAREVYRRRATQVIEAALPVLLAGGLPREPSEEAARAFDQAYEDAPLAPWVEGAALAEQDVSEILAGLRAAYREENRRLLDAKSKHV